jgi:hypothetical protein
MCGFEGDPKNVEREAQMVQSRTAGDNLAMLAIVGAGATASVGLMSVSARLMATAAATAAPFADQVARQAGAVAGTVLDKMQAAGRMVGAARLGAERAANELGSAITKMGYEFSRVSVAGQEYITAARATAGRFNAIGVNADGSTFNAVLQVGAKGALEVVK